MKLTKLLILSIALFSKGVLAIEIADFKFGLVCPNAKASVGWVCHEAKDIQITGQGKCVFDGKNLPCTWYGFSFHYSDAKTGDAIQCAYTTSQPVVMGNPTGVTGKETNSGKYELTIPEGSGTFFNPQYSVFVVEKRGGENRQDHTECSVDGKPVFSFDANLIYPNEQ